MQLMCGKSGKAKQESGRITSTGELASADGISRWRAGKSLLCPALPPCLRYAARLTRRHAGPSLVRGAAERGPRKCELYLLLLLLLLGGGGGGEREREKSIDNQEGLKVDKHNALCRVTLPLGARAPAYDGEYYTSTLRLALWHALRQHTRVPRPSVPITDQLSRGFGVPNRSPDPLVQRIGRDRPFFIVAGSPGGKGTSLVG